MSRLQTAREPGALWPIRRVFQAHEHGCGIACVAMLAGVGYWNVCLAIFGDLEGDATSLADIRDALRNYGMRVDQRATPFWERGYGQLRQHALLITGPDRCGSWHAAVWDAGRRRIVDPLRQPNRRPVVVGYMTVDRPMVAGNRRLSSGDDQGEVASARLHRSPAGRAAR